MSEIASLCHQCGRALIKRPRDAEATCGQCRNMPTSCDCDFFLTPVSDLLKELDKLDGSRRRAWIHRVIRALPGQPVERQQEYRDEILAKKYMRPMDWREALAEARKSSQDREEPSADVGTARQNTPPDGALDITEEPEAVRLITERIISGHFAEVYLRGDQLVQVTTGDDGVLARDLDDAILRRLIADHLPCVQRTNVGTVGALPRPITCKAILALPQWPKVRKLRGVATFPVPLPDGTVLHQPGYDTASGLYLREGLDVPPIPDRPSRDQIAAARGFLLSKFLADFPWTSDADRANAVAMLLTPLLREIIDDVFPFFYVTAPERGSGKTLVASLVRILYGGVMRVLPKDEKELEKAITSSLRGAAPVIAFDNIPQDTTIKSPSLAAVLTMRYWTARIMGGHRDGTWPNDRMWMATGTNVSLGGDFAQRSVRIAMDYGKPNPDLRHGFAIPEIESWTAGHRGEVLWQLLVLIRSWQIAGAQRDTRQVMRGYTPWAQTIGGILGFHQIAGFLGNRDEVVGQDEDDAEMAAFLHALRSRYGSDGRTTRHILEDAAADGHLADALPSTLDGGKQSSRSLGKLMSGHEGKWYGQRPKLTLRRKQDASSISWWRVEEWAD